MGQIKLTDRGPAYKGPYDPYIVEEIKSIPGRSWDKKNKIWHIPWSGVERLAKFPNVEVAPEVISLMDSYKEKQMMASYIKEEEAPEPLKEMPIRNIKPFAHQIKAFNIGITLPSTALLLEMGLGKTLSTIAIAGRRFLDGQVSRVLVVAPLSVLSVWEKEFEDYADFPCNVQALTSAGTIRNRAEMLLSMTDTEALQVGIINYEAVWREQMLNSIRDWNPDMIVADESQKLKGPNTRQSRAMHRLGEQARYKYILTGTPVTASPLDFWSQYRFLEPDIFGRSFYSFRSRYAMLQTVEIPGRPRFQKIKGYRNKDELVRKAHSIAFRVTKEEALDLPDWIDQKLYCYLEEGARKHYEELEKQSVTEIAQEEQSNYLIASNVLTRLLRLQQLTGGFLPDPNDQNRERKAQVSTAKINLLRDTLEDVFSDRPERKVVIFARFLPEIALIEEAVSDIVGEGNYCTVKGEIPLKERTEARYRFQEDDTTRVFVAQIQVAGLGVTLTAADLAIFYSLDFNFANYDQARARLHRIGAKSTVNYLHLLAHHTIDDRVFEVLQQKKNVADDVVNNWRKYVRQDTAKQEDLPGLSKSP